MWLMGTVLVVALMMAIDPIRIGFTLLLISRPRPILNLVAYWFGAMSVGVTSGIVVLTMMRDFAPALLQNLSSLAATPALRHAQIAVGVFALLLAPLITAGLPARRRLRVPVSVGGDPSALLVQPRAPTGISRLLGRARGVLEGESLWVALAAGLGTGPAPPEYLVALTAILASGGAIGKQISAAVAFNLVMLAVIEITLVSYLTTPTKTQAMIQLLHNWVRTHRRQILAVIVGVVGVGLMVTGIGST
jgi:hypothetical protein